MDAEIEAHAGVLDWVQELTAGQKAGEAREAGQLLVIAGLQATIARMDAEAQVCMPASL